MPEKTQEELLEEAALDSASDLQFSSVNVTEAELDDFDFYEDLEEIATELEIPLRVATFDHPQKPGKKIHYALRQLTASEHAEIFNSVFDAESLADVFEENENLSPSELKTKALTQAVGNMSDDNFAERHQQRQIAAVYKCIVRPKKKSKKALEAHPDDMIRKLYEMCSEHRNQEWQFHPVVITTKGRE